MHGCKVPLSVGSGVAWWPYGPWPFEKEDGTKRTRTTWTRTKRTTSTTVVTDKNKEGTVCGSHVTLPLSRFVVAPWRLTCRRPLDLSISGRRRGDAAMYAPPRTPDHFGGIGYGPGGPGSAVAPRTPMSTAGPLRNVGYDAASTAATPATVGRTGGVPAAAAQPWATPVGAGVAPRSDYLAATTPLRPASPVGAVDGVPVTPGGPAAKPAGAVHEAPNLQALATAAAQVDARLNADNAYPDLFQLFQCTVPRAQAGGTCASLTFMRHRHSCILLDQLRRRATTPRTRYRSLYDGRLSCCRTHCCSSTAVRTARRAREL